MSRFRWLAAAFALGLITDVLIVRYYLAVTAGQTVLAMAVSFAVTIVPFLVTWQGIESRRPALFVAYAFGAAIGTGIGMAVRV